MVVDVSTDEDIIRCFSTLKELRADLKKETFLQLVKSMMAEGYTLSAIEKDSIFVAVAGYKINVNFAMGKHLYVEDLATLESERSKGYGEELLEYLESKARSTDCSVLHLDSGTQRHRAHKFYLKNNMAIFAYHFVKSI